MTNFKFKFPRIEAETISVSAEDIVTAGGIAKRIREDHVRVTRLDGEEVVVQPSLIGGQTS